MNLNNPQVSDHPAAHLHWERTSRPWSIWGFLLVDYRDGLIHRKADYWSLATYLQQVGLMPAPQAHA